MNRENIIRYMIDCMGYDLETVSEYNSKELLEMIQQELNDTQFEDEPNTAEEIVKQYAH